jgi:hypothetical protein
MICSLKCPTKTIDLTGKRLAITTFRTGWMILIWSDFRRTERVMLPILPTLSRKNIALPVIPRALHLCGTSIFQPRHISAGASPAKAASIEKRPSRRDQTSL